MKYSAIVFDLDGTLLDTLEDLTNSLNAVLSQNGFEPRTTQEVKGFLGKGVGVLIGCALPEGKENPSFGTVLEDFKTNYATNSANKTKPYPQVLDLLKTLKEQGVKIGVVSNKYESAVKKLCPHYFGDLLDIVVGETPVIRRKPAPDSLLHVMEVLGTKKEETLFVGDSEVDAQTAQNAGVDFVGVTWGFRTPDDMRPFGAKVFINNPMELLDK